MIVLDITISKKGDGFYWSLPHLPQPGRGPFATEDEATADAHRLSSDAVSAIATLKERSGELDD